MARFGAVEVGGTKTDIAIGSSPTDLSSPFRIETTTPEATLGAVVEYFSGEDVAAIGVASFGPLDLDPSSDTYGTVLATPKPHWSGAEIYEYLREGTRAPVSLETDVNGAALGEGRWGAAAGMTDYAYMTVGTGIGVGVIVEGRPVHGDGHPEAGHIVVSRIKGDDYQGRCPYHGDCLEGVAAGPALEERFGRHETWAGNAAIVELVAKYVAQGLRSIVYITAPERIIVGGGVASLPGFHQRLRHELGELLAGYPKQRDLDLLVSKPGLGPLSGLSGALVIAEAATS